VNGLYDNFKSIGVEITTKPADRAHGLKDFGVKDLGDKIINFGCNVTC